MLDGTGNANETSAESGQVCRPWQHALNLSTAIKTTPSSVPCSLHAHSMFNAMSHGKCLLICVTIGLFPADSCTGNGASGWAILDRTSAKHVRPSASAFM